MKFIITVDTEADNQWKKKDVSLENVLCLPKFQEKCEQYGFLPTYLITYEVAADSRAVEILNTWRKSGRAEIGAHLHPWTNPPFIEGEDPKEQIFPSELPQEQLWNKLKRLTEIIEEKFGQAPTSFRAGRFGFNSQLAELLLRLGYLVDCSVTPKTSWTETQGKLNGFGGPDFRLAPLRPYFLSLSDVCQMGDSQLLEIPLSIIYTGLFREGSLFGRKFALMNKSFLNSVINRLLFKKKWLRIFPESKEKDWRAIYKAAKNNNLPVLEFMIHSSELLPGGSPYSRTEQMTENIFKQIDLMFGYFQKMGLEPATLASFYKEYKNV